LSVSGIGFHKNVPVKKWNKNAVPGKPLKRKLPGTDEEEKGEKNKRYEEHRPEQYRTIGPEIQEFLSDWRSFYQTCLSVPTVFRFHWKRGIKKKTCSRSSLASMSRRRSSVISLAI
jgi:hypothetical protein